MKRVAIFIDGNNFYFGLRKLYGVNRSLKKFDFGKFANFLSGKNEITMINYYNAALDKETSIKKYNSQKEFFEQLRKIPKLNLILCKLLKRKIFGTEKFYYILKEDDIHMAVDMVENAWGDRFDIAIVVSGDGDFVPAVNSLRKKGKLVRNVYFKNSSSRKLKEFSDECLELSETILDEFFN